MRFMPARLFLVLLLGTLALGLWAAPKAIDIPVNTIYSKSVTSLGGKVDVSGTVEESVVMFGGTLTISGQVNEDVICLWSDVTLSDGAVVKKDLMVIGGTLKKSENCKVYGTSIHLRTREDMKSIAYSMMPFIAGSGGASLLKVIKIVVWFALTLVVFALFPRRVREAQELLERRFRRVGVVGLLSLLFFVLGVLISIILSFFLVGIPLFFLLILGYFVLLVFGRTVIFSFIGHRLAAWLHLKQISPATYILLGVVVYSILKFIPVVGTILLLAIDIVVMGIGVSYFLRRRLAR